ncbi:MAG: glycosyltransferase family 2 protein [Candidatus Tritonobacter lacicola]|nr:glycosyltransferase family 2 protein [Candidatus Tritonobacter lacicola]
MVLNPEVFLDLSLVVPAYNEGSKIGRDLKELTDYLGGTGLSYEILVIDDGSVDSTAAVVSKFAGMCRNVVLLRNGRNRGKGYSVRKGVLAARGRYVGFLDAGLCVPPGEIGKALALLNDGCDIALGSRGLPDSSILRRQPWYRVAGSKIFAQIVWKIMGLSAIKDTQCGFKFFRREVAREIFSEMRTDGFMFDVELLRRALAKKLKIRQFPISWSNDPDTRFRLVSGSIRNMVELAGIVLRGRKNYHV